MTYNAPILGDFDGKWIVNIAHFTTAHIENIVKFYIYSISTASFYAMYSKSLETGMKPLNFQTFTTISLSHLLILAQFASVPFLHSLAEMMATKKVQLAIGNSLLYGGLSELVDRIRHIKVTHR